MIKYLNKVLLCFLFLYLRLQMHFTKHCNDYIFKTKLD